MALMRTKQLRMRCTRIECGLHKNCGYQWLHLNNGVHETPGENGKGEFILNAGWKHLPEFSRIKPVAAFYFFMVVMIIKINVN
jgi:hypothetical protein